MIRVIPKRNETIQSTLRRLRKLCEKDGLIKDMKRHMFYEKPSDKRRRDKLRAVKRRQKEDVDERNIIY